MRKALGSAVRRLLNNRVTITMRRASIVTRADRFLRAELRGPEGAVGTYRLRRSGRLFLIRHRSSDLEILHEVLLADGYAPPLEVAATLTTSRPRILDLGAHVGLFGVRALERWPDAEIVGFEPDPENFALLARCIRLNRAESQWKLMEACAMPWNGDVDFLPGEKSQSRVADAIDGSGAVTVAGLDVFPYLYGADILKIDIEGGEWALLSDPRFPQAGPPAIVLEYHSVSCPYPDAHDAAPRLLARAGYSVRPVFRHPELRLGVLWAWKDDPSCLDPSKRISGSGCSPARLAGDLD